MEAALVSASTGVMMPLVSKLTKLLVGDYAKLKGVRKKIMFLRDELSTMGAALQLLADAEELNPLVRVWRDKLRELAYDMEDCIDNFMSRVDRGQEGSTGFKGQFKELFRKLKKLQTRHEIAVEIDELKKRAIEASKMHKRYNFALGAHNSGIPTIDPRLLVLYKNMDKLVGIEEPKKDIIERLAMEGSSAKLKILSIVGCGGLGKTTLASQVYHTIKGQFSCAAFVSVSRNPDIKKILRDITKELGIGYDTINNDNECQLINKLREYLQDKRYFVIIDDIWDPKSWEAIELALLNNNSGSRVITTTRSLKVASHCSSQDGYVYQMESLSFADSKRLFCTRAFGSDEVCHPHLEEVCYGILEKCGGLPLALITVSSLLADKLLKDEWSRVLTSIGRSLALDPDAADMTKALSLSYFDLPHHLRTCFLYLSVFPEDYVIKKQRLINRWIAEGFIHEEQGQRAYEVGEHYFNDLINRSLIQPVDVEHGQATACRVHDIILDYIKCKAAEENFVTSLDAADHEYISEYKVRRLCVNNRDEENVNSLRSLILSHVRTLTVVRHPMQTSLSSFTALRVLDLEECWYLKDHHLANIGEMFHLKYLCISSISVTNLPGIIGELQYLETLDIQRTRIEELPSTMKKLYRLAHLYVHCRTRFPDGMIGHLQNLEELREYGVKSYNQGKAMQEFTKLTKLRTLRILLNFRWSDDSEGRSQAEDLRCYVGTLISSCNLHNLYIMDASDELYPLSLDSWRPAATCSLQKLHMNKCVTKVPIWMGSLGNLWVVELYIIFMTPEDVEILGAISTLVVLKLATSGGTNGRIIFHGKNGFRSLKYLSLVIGLCGTAVEFEVGSVPKLEHLQLAFGAHKMQCLNGASNLGLHHLSSLNKVDVEIKGNHCRDSNYDPAADVDDGIIRCVGRAIKDAVVILPNRPTVKFETKYDNDCEHFKFRLKEINEVCGLLTEWLKVWQIEKEETEQMEQVTVATAGDANWKLKKLPNLRDEANEEEQPADSGST